MEKHNILVLGSGGREHSLAWAIAKSPLTENLYIAPGNPGTAQEGINVELDINDHDAILEFIEENDITLTVIGPEKPLVDGLVDFLEDHGKLAFGPSEEAARLEGSKSFAKDIMLKYGVPTAGFQSFERHEWAKATEYISKCEMWPVVLKADGLAAGKGVFVCEDNEEALYALEMMQNDPNLSAASYRLVIEEFMTGEEVSVFAICDGSTFKTLFNAQDHKRIGDGDTGLNTGGMGAYGPVPGFNEEFGKEVDENIIGKMLDGMAAEGIPYKGILYCGLMLTPDGPKVVEFNCRFGDPECQVILPALKNDIVELMLASVHGKLEYIDVNVDDCFYTCVVLAAKGYPLNYKKGDVITGMPENSDDHHIFHCGTLVNESGQLVTNSGRVLNVVTRGATLKESIDRAYSIIEGIQYENKYFRKDIGFKGLKKG